MADLQGDLGVTGSVAPSHHRFLVINPPKNFSHLDLRPHEVRSTLDLDSADLHISEERPDIVVFFPGEESLNLENHVMTWLIEGFKGKFVVFDPFGYIQDYEELMHGKVIDDYIAGPVSVQRLETILKTKLIHDSPFATSRATTTFDLFRNLFDRGLSATFFFSEDLEHCVAANLKAEEVTGRTFAELKKLHLRNLCDPEEFEEILRLIRRAKNRYYDLKGNMKIVDRSGTEKSTEFSCGFFKFGRRHFVKLEIQVLRSANAG